MERKKYKHIKVQTLQSQVKNSVENEEKQGQANHESREASAQGFAFPGAYTCAEALPEEIIPIPIWWPFEDHHIDECTTNIICEGTCIHTAFSQTQPQSPSEPKVICYACKEEFLTKN